MEHFVFGSFFNILIIVYKEKRDVEFCLCADEEKLSTLRAMDKQAYIISVMLLFVIM